MAITAQDLFEAKMQHFHQNVLPFGIGETHHEKYVDFTRRTLEYYKHTFANPEFWTPEELEAFRLFMVWLSEQIPMRLLIEKPVITDWIVHCGVLTYVGTFLGSLRPLAIAIDRNRALIGGGGSKSIVAYLLDNELVRIPVHQPSSLAKELDTLCRDTVYSQEDQELTVSLRHILEMNSLYNQKNGKQTP
jgi:hypothetical protein